MGQLFDKCKHGHTVPLGCGGGLCPLCFECLRTGWIKPETEEEKSIVAGKVWDGEKWVN